MPQSDFESLAMETELADDDLNTRDTEIHANSEGNQQNMLTVVKNEDGMNSSSTYYVPVNFIPDEVLAYNADWESAYLSQMGSSDSMDLDSFTVSVSQGVFEPTRRLSDFAPPKRFYRRIWRSMTRRILAFPLT